MRWIGDIVQFAPPLTIITPFGPTSTAVFHPTLCKMIWEQHVLLATGNYLLKIEAFPFPTDEGMELDFILAPEHPTIGDSVIKTRWVRAMPDLGFTFNSSALIQLSESHTAPLDQFIEYSMEVCIYSNEP